MAAPKIFVSHSHNDDAFSERLVTDLRQAGADAWMDKTDLGAGNWQQRIDEALAGCEWFVLVLTRDALASPWVQQEVYAANRLKNQGRIRDLIFVQAQSMDHRELPATWGIFNIFDATTDYASARDRTLRAIELQPLSSGLPAAGQPSVPESKVPVIPPPPTPAQFPEWLAGLGFSAHADTSDRNVVPYILPPLALVPAGSFLMGSNPKRDPIAARESWSKDEQPQHTVTLPAFEIARFPVTVAEYACFVHAGHHEPTDWQRQQSRPEHPVVSVNWYDAVAYAAWLAHSTGEHWRLPTEAEWEKAARGTDSRIYPWGDSFDKARCNTSESRIKTTTPVGSDPTGASPYSAQDMAGNVWEWTSSHFLPYPYAVASEHEDAACAQKHVVRGGSWYNNAQLARAAYRSLHHKSIDFYNNFGFRLVRAVPNP